MLADVLAQRQNQLALRQEEILWDDRLKARARLRKGIEPESTGACRVVKDIIMILAVLIYAAINPMFKMPKWCTDAYSDPKNDFYNDFHGFFVDCQREFLCDYPVSGTGYVVQDVTCAFDLFCQFYIGFVTLRKVRRRVLEATDKFRYTMILIMLLISMIDTMLNWIFIYDGVVTCFLRPVIILLLFKNVRQSFTLVALNIKDSAVTLALIFIFMLYFAFWSTFIYYATFEGVAQTSTVWEGYWLFLVLLTTENYPDAILLAYEDAYFSIIFFAMFIVITVLYLQNILLAIVFDNYKKRVLEMSEKKIQKRMTYIKMYYDQFDDE